MTDLIFDPDAMRERIEETLTKSGRSQTDVAKKADLGHGYFTNVLKRKQMPSVDKLDKMCKELKVSMPWIIYGEEIPADFNRVLDLMNKDPKKFYALLALLE